MKRRILLVLAALASVALATVVPAHAQGGARLSVLRELGGGLHGVRVLAPSGNAPASDPQELQGIELLPFDVNARTQLTRYLPRSTRLIEDLPGAARALLARGEGSLYHFRRVEAAGGSAFGFFVVGADGRPRVVAVASGVGAAGDEDPWLARVAVAPDGRRMLAATTTSAGGDLWEVDLVLGSARSLTAASAPLAFVPESLVLNATLGAAATARGLWRFAPGSAQDAERVLFPGAQPAWLAGELVLALDGPHGVAVAGDGPASAHVWAFDASGPTRRASLNAEAISRAGYLPDFPHGPFFAISDDGSRVAWRSEGVVSREAFLAAPLTPAQPVQVTADALFVDTLDEIGQFQFVPFTTRLLASVGKRTLDTGIENLDVYSVDLSAAGGVTLVNLSTSSGDTTAPFQASSLKPEDFFLDPAGKRVIVLDRISGSGALRSLDLASGTLLTLLPHARGIDEAAWLGGDLALALRIEGSVDRRQLWLFPQAGATGAQLLQDAADDVRLRSFAVQDDQQLAWIESQLNGDEFVWRFARGASGPQRLTPRALSFASPLDFAQNEALGLGVGPSGGPNVIVSWPQAGAPLRLPGGGIALVLPGA